MTSQSEEQAILARLIEADHFLAELRDKPMTLELAEPPFWPGIQVAAVEIDLGHKPLLYRYAVTPTQVLNLATAYDFQTVNLLAGFSVELNWVPLYLRFFLDVTDRKIQLVDRADAPRWLANSAGDPVMGPIRSQAEALIHPIYVSPEGATNRAIVTVIVNRGLYERAYDVTPLGEVTLASDTVLLEGLPVPYVGF